MNELDLIKLNIYEAFNNGDITEDEKDYLLSEMEININSMNNDIFFEAYLGKTPLLLEAEKILDEMIIEMKRDPSSDYTNSPLNKKLESLLQKQFGFKEISIEWHRSAALAPTICTLLDYDVLVRMQDRMNMDMKKGYYDKKHSHMCLILASSTIPTQMNITGEEYLGILLHEVGHNFDLSLYMIIQLLINLVFIIYNGIRKILPHPIPHINREGDIDYVMGRELPIDSIVSILTNTIIGKKIHSIFNKGFEFILSYVPFLKKIGLTLKQILDFINKIFIYTFTPITTVVTVPTRILLSPISQLKTSFIRKNEQFADSFAAMYGYGTACMSGITKFDKIITFENTKDNPLIKFLTDLALANQYILVACEGSHGTNVDRINSSINYLKQELNALNINPRMKASMSKDIKVLEELRDGLLNTNENQKFIIAASVRLFINKICNGDSGYISALLPSNYA